MKIKAILSLVLLLALTPSAFAQTTTVQSYITTAIAAGNPGGTSTFTVVTAPTAPTATVKQSLYVDREYMIITAVNGTNVTVIRGQAGTKAGAHPIGSAVWYGPPGNGPFIMTGGTPSSGASCVTGYNSYNPVIVVETGDIWKCNTTSLRWTLDNLTQIVSAFKRTPVADAAITLTLSDIGFVPYSTISAARTATLPAITGIDGAWFVFTEEAASAGAGQTITITGASGQLIGGASSGALTTTCVGLGCTVRLYSGANTWHTW